MNYREQAFEQIDQAPIASTLFRAAVRLLFAADDLYGQIKATKSFVCERCRVGSWGAARRMLGDLVSAGILGYRSEGDIVFVDFKAWPARSILVAGPRENGSQSAPPIGLLVIGSIGSGLDQPIEPTNQLVAETDWLVGSQAKGTEPLGEDALTENPETQPDDRSSPQLEPMPPLPVAAGFPPSAPEQQRSFALLTDPDLTPDTDPERRCGLNPKVAQTFTQSHRFEWLLQQIGTYWVQYQDGQVSGPGALKNRIANNWRPEEWCSEFLASDYYRRHYPVSLTDDERAAWASYRKYGNLMDSVVGLEHVADQVTVLLTRLSDRERYWLEVLPLPLEGETSERQDT